MTQAPILNLKNKVGSGKTKMFLFLDLNLQKQIKSKQGLYSLGQTSQDARLNLKRKKSVER